MNAADIAGAVVWTPLALSLWWNLIGHRGEMNGGAMTVGAVLSLGSSLGAVYCIARLAGAQ